MAIRLTRLATVTPSEESVTWPPSHRLLKDKVAKRKEASLHVLERRDCHPLFSEIPLWDQLGPFLLGEATTGPNNFVETLLCLGARYHPGHVKIRTRVAHLAFKLGALVSSS